MQVPSIRPERTSGESCASRSSQRARAIRTGSRATPSFESLEQPPTWPAYFPRLKRHPRRYSIPHSCSSTRSALTRAAWPPMSPPSSRLRRRCRRAAPSPGLSEGPRLGSKWEPPTNIFRPLPTTLTKTSTSRSSTLPFVDEDISDDDQHTAAPRSRRGALKQRRLRC